MQSRASLDGFGAGSLALDVGFDTILGQLVVQHSMTWTCMIDVLFALVAETFAFA